jgi:2-polyprenyl-6-methoxyphenol hydroxylase-like FAD-dependent oxidoreductase
MLNKTGLADAVLRATTPDRQSWVARFGVLVDKRPGDQEGIFYAPLVNTLRAEIPATVPFVNAKATALVTGDERQQVTLSNGETVSARLVVLANGLNVGLQKSLGLTREMLSECHSVSIGFDIRPLGRRAFDFPALTYYAKRPSDKTALLTLFPIGGVMRANLFTYRDLQDPWLSQLRATPQETLFALMPGLSKLTGDFAVEGFIKIRPVDLYTIRGHLQPGVVLVGDAFSTSCPAAGTGARKVLTDVERLCNVYIPRWLATPGLGTDKIASFYDDPVKKACDDFAITKAYSLKSFSIDRGISASALRWAKFLAHFALGKLRQMRQRSGSKPGGPKGIPATADAGS